MMRNPFLNQYRHLIIYISVWMLISLVQTEIFFAFLTSSKSDLLIQFLLSNTIFAALSLAYWNMIRFIPFTRQYIFILNHLVLVLLFFSLWNLAFTFSMQMFIWGLNADFQNHDSTFNFRQFSGVLLYGLILLIYYLYKYAHSIHEKVERESALYRAVKDTELQLLKSQLHPHFIFNSLNSLNALIEFNSGSAQEMLLKLSEYLRKSLEYKDTSSVSLEEELAYGKLYLDIEKIRFGDRLAVEENIDPTCLSTKIPHMLLQPLYENVIKHGLGQSLGKVVLVTKVVMLENMVVIAIENNFENSQLLERKGMGIKNVQKRLSLFYGRRDCFQMQRSLNSFEVKLTIPKTN